MTKAKTPGRKESDRERRPRCAGTAGHFPGSGLPDRGGHDWLHRLGQTRLPVRSENGDELDARAEEARLDAFFCGWPCSSCRMTKSSGSCLSKTCPTSTWCTATPVGEAPNPDGARRGPANSTVPTLSTAVVPLQRRGRVVRYRTCSSSIRVLRRMVQLLAEAGLKLKLEVLTDSSANICMHSRTRLPSVPLT